MANRALRRERAYIAAAAALYTSGDAGTQRARTVAYEQGMEKLVAQFPADGHEIDALLRMADERLRADKLPSDRLA